MFELDSHPSGRHFLQIPGPTNVPDRVLRAIDRPTIDHRGPEFGKLGLAVLDGVKKVFKTASPVVIYPASGTGAWEAALVNTLSPGDKVLMAETGHFATLVAQARRAIAADRGLHSRRLASGRECSRDREALAADAGQYDQGRVRRSQRDVDRRHQQHPRGARGDRPRRPPGALPGGHDLFAGLDRLPPRRVGRRCHGWRLAERD
jgi:alanine-glyoxylate transaminase / serine-glyoxylate transaminase / serine-pyruvate transaminase